MSKPELSILPAQEVEKFVETLFPSSIETATPAELTTRIVLWIVAPVGETSYTYVCDQDCVLREAWCTSATCIIANSAGWTQSNYVANTGIQRGIVALSTSALVYKLNWAFKKGDKVYFDLAGSSRLNATFT